MGNLKISISLGLLVLYASAAKTATLCKPRENVFFSCELRHAKTVSICESAGENQRYVEYKFGKPSNIELVHRADNKNADQLFQRADFIFGNNAVDTIWFRNGEYLYDVSMPARGAPAVEVWKKNEQLTRIECNGGWANVEGDADMASPFIVNHGSVDVSQRDALWFEK